MTGAEGVESVAGPPGRHAGGNLFKRYRRIRSQLLLNTAADFPAAVQHVRSAFAPDDRPPACEKIHPSVAENRVLPAGRNVAAQPATRGLPEHHVADLMLELPL